MSRVKLNSDNRIKIIVLVSLLYLFFIISFVLPLLFVKYLSFSGLGTFFIENRYYGFISLFIVFYFILVGEYYYRIKIDPYSIQLTSYRPIIDFFRKKDSIDISHSMLDSYSFFNRSYSFNKTLMIRVRNSSGKRIIKRFELSLMGNQEVKKISNIFDDIVKKNKTHE